MTSLAVHRFLTPKRGKYRSRATGGYASAKEARRAQELKLLERAGKIRNLREQVPFVLIPAQKIDGKLVERQCAYVADFVYEEPGHKGTPIVTQKKGGEFRFDPFASTVVEDVKGMRTRDYIIKRKLMLMVHGIRIREV